MDEAVIDLCSIAIVGIVLWIARISRPWPDQTTATATPIRQSRMQSASTLSKLLDQPEEFIKDAAAALDGSDNQDDDLVAEKQLDAHAGQQHHDGFCVECEDQPASLFCQLCLDDYCDVCFQAMHRKGKRRGHQAKRIGPQQTGQRLDASSDRLEQHQQHVDGDVAADVDADALVTVDQIDVSPIAHARDASAESFEERAKWIPVRLNLKERKALRLLEAALSVSEYTDKIDVVSYRSNKPQRMVQQIKDLCAILCGLVVASDYNTGQTLIQDKDYKYNEDFFRKIFEIGRRHKIMNPEKMRSTYGKLVYLLMDAVSSEVSEMLEFTCVKHIVTVYSLLEKNDALKLLQEPLMETATMEIIPEGKSRYEIQREIKQKERAIEYLAQRHRTKTLSSDDIKLCLYSIGDNNSFLRSNRDPCDKMIALLQEHFLPDRYDDKAFCLAISAGFSGARLSHSHERQYYYVLQSLTLWSEMNHNMFKLWSLSEQDMLDQSNPYRLRDTGQGLNRLQSCPRVSKAVHGILAKVMRQVGNWVGSSVVHLGDTNVPNALMFIDKYTQVARILNPIVLCIEKIDAVADNAELGNYIDAAFGSVNHCKKAILTDFFKHAFDGSGADNFFDAGSCIDGRLTSAWNWCHSVEKKPFFPVFLLTGFIGFDGEF